MTRRLSTIALGVVMWTALVAAGHHHLKHEFYIYDTSTKDFICAVVTVSYEGGSQTAEARTKGGELGGVMFLIPGEPYYGYVTVEADGYITDERTVVLGGRPHVGGKAFYIGLDPLLAR
jgi:hypothetical protein